MASAEVELPGGRRRRVRPRITDGDDRAALWPRMVAVYQPYVTYTQRQIEPAGD